MNEGSLTYKIIQRREKRRGWEKEPGHLEEFGAKV